LDRVQHLKERLAQSPEASIPEMASLTEQDWLLATSEMINSEGNDRWAFSYLRSMAEGRYLCTMRDAVVEYAKANDGKWPADLAQITPYLKTPVEDAILQRYEIVQPDSLLLPTPISNWVLTEKAPVDSEYDLRHMVGADDFTGLRFKDLETIKTLTPVIQAYFAANNGQTPEDADLEKFAPYAGTAEQQDALAAATRRYESASVEYRGTIRNIINSLRPK
jgi:hypothetical protein